MLGAKIKKYILNAGLKIGSVALSLDIPFNIFSSMLNGRRSIKAEEYFKICSVLNLPLEYFVN
ncbi:MAG: helix-turn-helix transcriptional regulator [Clostridia bacterium]|nr:helix-turn-helix transcriptional regulator [Clostridia bacterium]